MSWEWLSVAGMMMAPPPRKSSNNNSNHRDKDYDDESLSAGWGDKRIDAKGPHVFAVVLFAISLGTVVFSDYKQGERIELVARGIETGVVARYNAAQSAEIVRHEEIERSNALILANQYKIMNAIALQTEESTKFRQEWIYMQSLDERQRRALQLEMPPSLQQRRR